MPVAEAQTVTTTCRALHIPEFTLLSDKTLNFNTQRVYRIALAVSMTLYLHTLQLLII